MKGSESDTPVAEVSALAISTYSSLFSAAPRGFRDLSPQFLRPWAVDAQRSGRRAAKEAAPFWLCVMYHVSAHSP